jgi:hypothetical protein
VLDNATALVAASAELLEGLAAGQRPLGAVSASLAELATTLGVEQVIVAIDDGVYGRQVFCSGRTPLGEGGDLLAGPARARTNPPSALDDSTSRLIVAAVAAAFERARTRQSSPARSELLSGLEVAADRSVRYGWGFTLVVLRLDRPDERASRQLAGQLRSSDTLVDLGLREYGIVLPHVGGDEIPRVLARVGRSGGIPTFCYGLATCPGDTVEPGALLALATARMHEADESRTDAPAPEIHASRQPLV